MAAQDAGAWKLRPAADGRVAIPLKAMGKEFLMSISIIPQAEAATSRGLGGRIVQFELFGDEVDLYESSRGKVVTDDLPTRRLITTFPIAKREGNQIEIDFNRGMRRIFTDGWYGDAEFSANLIDDALEVPQSRVFLVKQHDQRLEIRQAVQARSRQVRQDVESRMEVRYFISPYEKVKYQMKENTAADSRYVRFFQTSGILEPTSGRPVSHIARFDIKNPVTFYYSENTPDDYVDAVREGVLYWNRAFGKELVRCEKAPKGVTAPSPDHNVVQWVPWDSAGFAYADILVDPRTGRSMHGQAYMTSVFAISGVERARLILRRMQAVAKKPPAEKDDKDDDGKDDGKDDGDGGHRVSRRALDPLGMPLFQSPASCRSDYGEYAAQLAEGLEKVLAEAAVTDAGILRASQDYVRNVTAHEVGHVLGLRHNFAGSLAGNISPKEMDEWFGKYLTNDEPPEMKDRFTTNSVMEYSHFQAAVFNGCKMRTTEEVLPHDRAAIQWGYFGKTDVSEKKMLFGTDDDVGSYGDLRTFDYGSEPVIAALNDMGDALNGLPQRLIERFVAAKAPRDARDAIALDRVSLDAGAYASSFISDYRSAFRWFNKSTRSLRIERDFPYVGPLNEKERYEAHWKDLNQQVTKAGGVDRLGFAALPLTLTLDLKPEVDGATPPEKFDAKKMTAKLAELLDSKAYEEFVGADGKKHSFSAEEKELIKARAEKFFLEYEKELVTRIFQTWASTPRNLGVAVEGRVADDDIVAKFEKQILAAARHVILARDEKDEDKRISGKVDKSIVEVVDFTYPFETRLAAAQALADRAGSYQAWAKESRSSINKALKELVDASLNINNFKAFSDSNLSRPLRDWYLEQQRLLRELP